jgi:MFS transporter
MSVLETLSPPIDARSTQERARLLRIYVAEGLASVAANLLTFGVFFYTREEFGWTTRQNLMLSAAMGVVYTVGALCAHPVAVRLGAKRALAICCGVSAAIAGVAAWQRESQVVVSLSILAYFLLNTICWPVLENLVSTGEVRAHELSRRIAVYNLVWSGVSVVTVALAGTVIEHFRPGIFLLPMIGCIGAAMIALLGHVEPRSNGSSIAPAEPEPQLARQRSQAMWLARISVPALYVATFALAAMMPSLPILQSYPPTVQTLLSSVWLLVRFVMFLVLGATVFWHTRPRLLVAAAVLMLGGFIATTELGMVGLIVGQIVLGVATGLIFTASLYFGMVLSEGSAESGGHHEALIGIGMTLGPGAGVVTQCFWPASQIATVAAVSGIVGVTIALACGVAIMHARTTARLHRV